METIRPDNTPDLLLGISVADTQLDAPDMDQARRERLGRTQNIMKSVDPSVARTVLPEPDTRSPEDKAATTIQASYRGHLGRKDYINQLYNQYEQEEAMRLEKTLQQVEEGELLVENHRLEVELDDNTTTRRNKSRQYLSHVLTIQRAWRRYRSGQQVAAGDRKQVLTLGGRRVTCNMSPAPSETDDQTDESDESISGQQAMSVSSPDEDADLKNLPNGGLVKEAWVKNNAELPQDDGGRNSLLPGGYRAFIEPEPDSVVSDYSEMAESVKEHLANVEIIQKEDLEEGNTVAASAATTSQKIIREPNETDEEFSKRVRKINLLSLAQEFAALKKIDASALPFDHLKGNKDQASPMSDSSATETDSSERYFSSAGPSNATTPMDVNQEFLPPDIIESHSYNDKINTSTTIDNVSNKLQNTELTDRPPGGSNTQHISDTPQPANDNQATFKPANQNKGQGTKDIEGSDWTDSTSQREKGVSDRKGSGDNRTGVPGSMTGSMVVGDFDVYNIETTMPHMDWDLLEEQLQRAAEEERQKSESRRNDREEIRKKLAMAGADEEYYGGERIYKKPNLQTRLQSGMNLQICFMNQTEQDARGGTASKGNSQEEQPTDQTAAEVQVPCPQPPGETPAQGGDGIKPDKNKEKEDEDFFTRQARLQQEARMALAQVRPMAHMQLEIEKQMRKKSPIAEIVGIPGFGDGKRRKLKHHHLFQMNIAQLQVVVNDLHAQIENLNEDLVRMLVERDDLHMAQDSMLVDIEDLTRRVKESTKVMNNKKPNKRK